MDAYIKIAITSTSNVSDKATFRIDDVVFTYLESTTTTETKHSDYVTSCTPQYTITLNPNGGTIDDNDWIYDNGTGYYTQTVSEGTVLNFPTATKTGYTNTGWKKNNTGNAVASITASENATYTAAYDCALATVGISGTYALTVGDVFELVATAYDSNGDVLTCPANTTYSWERYNSVDGVWEAITDDNSDGDDAKLTFNNCQIANCGTYRCHVSYGECEASSHTTAADGGFNVHCFHLKGYFEGDWGIEYAFNHTDEEGIATLTLDLISGRTHYFNIYDGISQYGNGGTITASVTGWTYETTINSDTKLQTGADGSYVFTLNYTQLINNSTNILVLDVTYPPSNQSEGYTIYYDNLVHNWQNVYYRIGHTGHNMNSTMELVPGTSHLYKCITPQYDDFEAWQVANNVAWSGEHSIYNVNTNDQYAITHATEYKKFVVVEDITLTPDADGTFVNGENCTYYPAAKQAGMKKHNARVIPATGGTITVSYTDHDGTAKSDFTSGDRDLAHTCLLTITATPDAGYKLGTLTVNDVAFTSGTVHRLTEDAVIKVTWTEKATPTFAWSAATCTAALEADNTFPTLSNPDNLSVTYKSSDEDVAKIDENGDVILGAVGETEITATGAETATHKSATTTYKLTVVESNCKWVEVEIEDISPEDEVLVTMGNDKIVYALGTEKITNSPKAKEFNVIGNYLEDSNYSNYFGYSWYIIKTNDGYQLKSYTDNSKFLYGVSSYITISDSPTTFSIFKSTENGNECFSYIASSVYYLMYGVENSQPAWKRATTTNHLTSQTLKFYKRECLDATNYWVTWDAGEGAWEDKSSKKIESYTVGEAITKPENPTREGHRFDGWTPEPTTMPAENTTFTAVWTKVYKITWYENGVPSYTEVPSDNPVVTWEDNIADCGEKKFYGWTADDTFVSDPTTPPTCIEKGIRIAGDVTYYAVYADATEPANPGYEKVTTISEGIYLIATDNSVNKAYTGKSGSNSYGGSCDVEIENDIISEPESAVEVTVTLNGSNFYMHDGTYYLGYTSGNAMTFDASIQTGNQNIWKLTTEGYIESVNVSGRILQYNSGSPRFACYSTNQKKAYLYKKQTTTYANFAVSCATYDISVTTPTGGTVTTTPADEAGAGQKITVNVTPAECKYLTALKYNDGSDHNIDIASTPYTFTMPAADVTVTATFADKTATDIEILTSAHRMLMQGSAFVGEQVRITYNNGDKETLNWNDSRLTFTGHNTATLGSQTVTVTYNGCGTQSASYNIEVIDGLGITFWDDDYTETIKYEPGDLVDVDNKIGQNICSGWEFAGWSETKVANESNGFTPVHNFNATDAKVLYAVYVETSTDWISAYNIDELHSGAKYVIVAHYGDSKEYALTNTNNTNSSYLDGANLTTDCEQVREGDAYPYKDRYKLKVTPQPSWKWQLVNTGSGWTMRNISANKYLKINTDESISLTTTPDDKFTLSNGSNDSEITAQSSSNYYLSWYNSSKYWNGYSSGKQYYLTNETNFTSTPPCSPLSATFYGNGGIVTDGIKSGDYLPIKEPTRDAGITTPTASFADCNGKSWTFVGWSRKEIDVTRVPVLTTDLLHDGGGNKHYYIQEDGEEFWAVYTNIGDPETKYGTITFTDDDVTRQYENAKTITKSVTAMGDYDFELYHVSNASSLGIQFDHNSTPKGYIKNITSLGKINSISLNAFQTGDIEDVKVYVGNTSDAINILLTEADLQQTGNTYTYYPQKNYAYVKIEANGYCGITSISIDFGKGTQIWATTPDCSVLTLSGDEVYVTSTNGQSIRAAAQLTVRARQLPTNLVLTSNNSDVYFSTEKDANFTKAVAKQPKQLLTLDVDGNGNLDNTTIYVHYKPSSEGDGISEEVVVSANLETPNPSITDDHTIHVRNLPATFAIVAKVGDVWYALPSQGLNSITPPAAYPIEVDNQDDPTVVTSVPDNADWSLRQVYASSGSNDRFADNGEKLVFVNDANPQKALNAGSTGNYLLTDAQYDGYHNTTNPGLYEWTPTTTDLETYQLTNEQRSRTLSVNTATVFGAHAQDKAVEQVRFLPIQNRYTPAALQVVEWKENSVVIMYNGDPAQTASVSVNGGEAQETDLSSASAQRDIAVYELAANGLAVNPTQRLSITIGAEKVILSIPYIISGAQTDLALLPGSTVAARQEVAKVSDMVILKGATLTADGAKGNPYNFRNVTIYGGGKLVIPSEAKGFGVASLTLRAGGVTDAGEYDYVYPQFELRGTFTNSAAKINYDYITDYYHWYHLVLPFAGDLGTIKYPTEFYGANVAADNTGSWQIKRYAGEIRATGNYNAWVDIEKEGETSTIAGQGYIFWGAPKKVSVNGGDTERQKWGIQRITMSVTASDAETEKEDKTIAGLGSYENVPYNSGADNDQGWNLIGNPYMVNLTGLNSQSLQIGQLIHETDASGNWTGKWQWDDTSEQTGLRYVTIPSDHFETYDAKPMTWFTEGNPMIAGRSFFVQIAGDATDLVFDVTKKAALVPALLAENNDKPVDIETGIILSNEILQDEVNFWIKDGKTNDYEYNADYPKTPNNNQFNIYGVHTNGDLSWVATGPEYAAESMPIGYQVPAAGTYMLSLSEIYNSDGLDALYVTDHALSPEVTVDIMSEPYEFSVNQAETNNERFTVSVRVKAKTENGATGLGNVGAEGEQIHKFIYQDKMYILHHGVIYDATGKRVITINK